MPSNQLERSIDLADRLQRWNLRQIPTRPCIEKLWNEIEQKDDWSLFRDWLHEVVII